MGFGLPLAFTIVNPWACALLYHAAGTRAFCRSQKMRLHCGSQYDICIRPTCSPSERALLQGLLMKGPWEPKQDLSF